MKLQLPVSHHYYCGAIRTVGMCFRAAEAAVGSGPPDWLAELLQVGNSHMTAGGPLSPAVPVPTLD